MNANSSLCLRLSKQFFFSGLVNLGADSHRMSAMNARLTDFERILAMTATPCGIHVPKLLKWTMDSALEVSHVTLTQPGQGGNIMRIPFVQGVPQWQQRYKLRA